MPTYVLLSTLTDEGRKIVEEQPDRIKEVDKVIEGMGAQVISQYSVSGQYDLISTVEAPDDETIARVCEELKSHVAAQITTLPAIPTALEAVEMPGFFGKIRDYISALTPKS